MPNYFEQSGVASARAADQEQKMNSYLFPNVIAQIQDKFTPTTTPIYVYNISQIEFNTPRPPNHPHMLLRACPVGQKYLLVGTLEHPFSEIDYDQNGGRKVNYISGYREATVMLSPQNPGTDQNFDSPDLLSVGGNLNNYGVFWSISNPPTEDELKAARQRMERTYRQELDRLAGIEARSPEEARDAANNISHAAANFFGRSYSWHRSDLVPKEALGKVPCGVCGESIQAAAKICVHCGAPTDEKKQAVWLEEQFASKRGRLRGAEVEPAA